MSLASQLLFGRQPASLFGGLVLAQTAGNAVQQGPGCLQQVEAEVLPGPQAGDEEHQHGGVGTQVGVDPQHN